MQVRGAPLIGAAAAYGVALAMAADPSDAGIERGVGDARGDPADRGQSALGARGDGARAGQLPPRRRSHAALARAGEIAEDDVAINRAIGEHGAG